MKKYIRVQGSTILEIRQEQFGDAIEIETDIPDLEVIINHKYEGGKLVKNVEVQQKRILKGELDEIQVWFSQNDWKVNKIALGEWEANDPRYIEYINERKAKRQRQDEITNLLER